MLAAEGETSVDGWQQIWTCPQGKTEVRRMEEKSKRCKDGRQKSDAESCVRETNGREQERKPNPKHKEFWRLHKDEQLRKMMVGLHKTPNKLELKLIDLIERNHLQFRYVGNWEFILGGKCPDFLSMGGKKQIIELFGSHWHTIKSRESTDERIAHFKRFGFDTLILWERDLDNEDQTLQKILRFEQESRPLATLSS